MRDVQTSGVGFAIPSLLSHLSQDRIRGATCGPSPPLEFVYFSGGADRGESAMGELKIGSL